MNVFPCLEPGARFPALGTLYIFSRAWKRVHVFPRLKPGAYSPALRTGYIFSCAWHRMHVFALGTGCMLSRAWHPVRAFASSTDWLITLFELTVINTIASECFSFNQIYEFGGFSVFSD